MQRITSISIGNRPGTQGLSLPADAEILAVEFCRSYIAVLSRGTWGLDDEMRPRTLVLVPDGGNAPLRGEARAIGAAGEFMVFEMIPLPAAETLGSSPITAPMAAAGVEQMRRMLPRERLFGIDVDQAVRSIYAIMHKASLG